MTAADRDRTADAHDKTSEERDERSAARDERAEARARGGDLDVDAASDRAGAERDRQSSATDRLHAMHDRQAAASDRALADDERSALVLDGLTGAHLRAPGLLELEREVVKAQRTGRPFVLAFVDVDGLKVANDTHGHQAGDELVKQVVSTIRVTVREYDLIVRYGGDEFLCGLQDLGLADAAQRFADTRSAFVVNQNASYSVGLAQLAPGETLEELISRADRAMYEERRRLREA